MRLPPIVMILGYAGLLPFLAGPLWLTLMPDSAPASLDAWWLHFVAMVTIFMAGTFWGFALPACEGPEGKLGLAMSAALAVLAWLSLLLSFKLALIGLAAVMILQWLAEFWFEHNLGRVEGYFRMRSILTAGACLAIVWRLLI